MSQVTVYSSAPVSSQLAGAFQGLKNLGIEVIVRPLSALPVRPRPGQVEAPLRAEHLQVCLRLAAIGEQLDAHEQGRQLLAAGEENGLRAERDALQARKRGLESSRRDLRERRPPGG